jgi:hypothetical protein
MKKKLLEGKKLRQRARWRSRKGKSYSPAAAGPILDGIIYHDKNSGRACRVVAETFRRRTCLLGFFMKRNKAEAHG